jgi:hypothetical protein
MEVETKIFLQSILLWTYLLWSTYLWAYLKVSLNIKYSLQSHQLAFINVLYIDCITQGPRTKHVLCSALIFEEIFLKEWIVYKVRLSKLTMNRGASWPQAPPRLPTDNVPRNTSHSQKPHSQ